MVDGGWWMVDGARQMQDQAESDLRDGDTQLIQSQEQCHTLEPCHQQKYFISVESFYKVNSLIREKLYMFFASSFQPRNREMILLGELCHFVQFQWKIILKKYSTFLAYFT